MARSINQCEGILLHGCNLLFCADEAFLWILFADSNVVEVLRERFLDCSVIIGKAVRRDCGSHVHPWTTNFRFQPSAEVERASLKLALQNVAVPRTHVDLVVVIIRSRESGREAPQSGCAWRSADSKEGRNEMVPRVACFSFQLRAFLIRSL